MHRNQAGRSWSSKATVYTLSSVLTGVITGALLGIVGHFLSLEFRLALGSFLAVMAIVIGCLELFGHHIQLLQRDCETPQRWIHKGPLRWAIRNGLALGFGAMSRLGFWLWYVVPAGALLTGRPLLGAVIYGSYGLARGSGAWGLMLGYQRLNFNLSDWLFEQTGVARVLAAGQLVFLGVAAAIAIGI